jgi:hypothetical protein
MTILMLCPASTHLRCWLVAVVELRLAAVLCCVVVCCWPPQVKIARVLAQREQQQRKRNLTKYIPDAAGAIWTVLEKMAASQPKGPKRRRLQQLHSDILPRVQRKEVSRQGSRARRRRRRRWMRKEHHGGWLVLNERHSCLGSLNYEILLAFVQNMA